MGVSRNIYKIAKAKKISLKKLSSMVEMPYTTLYNEIKRDTNVKNIVRIAEALECSVYTLYDDKATDELMDKLLGKKGCVEILPIKMNDGNIKDEAHQLIDKYFMPAKAIIVKDFLNTYGFWDAPASTKYHGNHPGGLAEHSLAVAKNLLMLTEKLGLKWDNPGSPVVVGLLHDVCKMDQYKLIGTENGYQYVYTNDSIYSHHGEKSICMLASCVTLTQEEIACIRWHMGAYETDTNEWKYYGNAIAKYPNVLWTHTADMMASHIEGV